MFGDAPTMAQNKLQNTKNAKSLETIAKKSQKQKIIQNKEKIIKKERQNAIVEIKEAKR